MPALDRVLTCCCEKLWGWGRDVPGSKGVTYTITFSVHRGWECTCPGFKYRHTCKHLEDPKLKEGWCDWGMDAFANTIYHEDKCPACGGPVRQFYVGV